MHVGRKLGDNGYGSGFHDPLNYHACNFRVLTNGSAHATFGHAVRAAEVEFEPMCAGVLHLFYEFVPTVFIVVRHERNNHCMVGKFFEYFTNFFKVNVERTVADEFDVVEAHHPLSAKVDGRVTAAYILYLASQSFPNHATPAGFEGT